MARALTAETKLTDANATVDYFARHGSVARDRKMATIGYPHRLIPDMQAEFPIAIAENDDMGDPAAEDKLREGFDAAGLPAEIEVYADARHGRCVPDSTVYNENQAERAWTRLLALFERALA